MFGMFEQPAVPNELKKSEEPREFNAWVGEPATSTLGENVDGSVGEMNQMASLRASYEADRNTQAVREREATLGELVQSSAIGTEHIHMSATEDEPADLDVKRAEREMQMSMQAFFEASQANTETDTEHPDLKAAA